MRKVMIIPPMAVALVALLSFCSFSGAPQRICFDGQFEPHRALQLVLGNLAPENKDVVWNLTEYLARAPEKRNTLKGGGAFETSKMVITAPDKVLKWEVPEQGVILLTGTKPYDSPGKTYDNQMYGCVACSPLLGAQLWLHRGNQWCLVAEDRAITRMGGAGWLAYEKVEVVRVGPKRSGVLFEDDMSHGGYAPIRSTIIIPSGTGFLVAFDEITAEDNEGYLGKWDKRFYKYTAKIEFVPGANPEYFDLKITTSGNKLNDADRRIPWNREKTYTLSNGKYVLQKDRPTSAKHKAKK